MRSIALLQRPHVGAEAWCAQKSSSALGIPFWAHTVGVVGKYCCVSVDALGLGYGTGSLQVLCRFTVQLLFFCLSGPCKIVHSTPGGGVHLDLADSFIGGHVKTKKRDMFIASAIFNAPLAGAQSM